MEALTLRHKKILVILERYRQDEGDVFEPMSSRHSDTMNELQQQGLIERNTKGDWRITDAGIEVVEANRLLEALR